MNCNTSFDVLCTLPSDDARLEVLDVELQCLNDLGLDTMMRILCAFDDSIGRSRAAFKLANHLQIAHLRSVDLIRFLNVFQTDLIKYNALKLAMDKALVIENSIVYDALIPFSTDENKLRALELVVQKTGPVSRVLLPHVLASFSRGFRAAASAAASGSPSVVPTSERPVFHDGGIAAYLKAYPH